MKTKILVIKSENKYSRCCTYGYKKIKIHLCGYTGHHSKNMDDIII